MNWLLTTCAAPLLTPFSTNEKRPPLGVGSLISVLRRDGHQVDFIDNYLKPDNFLDTGFLARRRVDAVGIYVNTICFQEFLEMAGKLQKLRRTGKWKGIIVVGGPHSSVRPETIPDFVDHVVIGEGEQAILEIEKTGCPRIVQSPLIKNLDSLPPPPWDEFLALPYHWTAKWIKSSPVVSMNTSRGCPFECAFCSVKAIWGRTYRSFSVDWIMDNIDYLTARHGVKAIYFREDNFTVSKKRVFEFCERIRQGHPGLEWICETRVDTLDHELLKTMSESGCRGLYLGVESGSQRLLDFMDKGITVEQIENVFAWCAGLGIKTYASMIVGVPTETEEDRQATEALLCRIQPDHFSKNIFVGLPTSKLQQYAIEHGLVDYVDRRGMIYLPGHDRRVDIYYGGDESRKIPRPFREHYVLSRDLLAQGRRGQAISHAARAVLLSPANAKCWRNLVKTLLPRAAVPIAEQAAGYGYKRKIERAAARLAETAKYGLTRPAARLEFFIVSSQHNAGEAALKCLDSVYNQNYARELVNHIFIDDASTDHTPRLVEAWLENHQDHRVTYLRNALRRRLAANNYRGFGMAGPRSIVVELNGDDWLSDPDALSFLNKVYSDPEAWMTYNTYRFFRNGRLAEPAETAPVPKEVIANNSFREHKWLSSHLHSFRAELFRHLRKDDLIDPETGDFWDASTDLAFYLPLLELAGRHSRHIHRIMCVYNFHDKSLGKLEPDKQQRNARRIRKMEKYHPLGRLDSPPPETKNETDDGGGTR